MASLRNPQREVLISCMLSEVIDASFPSDHRFPPYDISLDPDGDSSDLDRPRKRQAFVVHQLVDHRLADAD